MVLGRSRLWSAEYEKDDPKPVILCTGSPYCEATFKAKDRSDRSSISLYSTGYKRVYNAGPAETETKGLSYKSFWKKKKRSLSILQLIDPKILFEAIRLL